MCALAYLWEAVKGGGDRCSGGEIKGVNGNIGLVEFRAVDDKEGGW